MQAPAAPLLGHSARQIADHAQPPPGKITEERREPREEHEPKQPHLPLDAVVQPVVARSRIHRHRRRHVLPSRRHAQHLAAQAVPDIEQRKRGIGVAGLHQHRGEILLDPRAHACIQSPQRPRTRAAHAAVVEREDVHAAFGEEFREGSVEIAAHAHGRADAKGGPRTSRRREAGHGELVPVDRARARLHPSPYRLRTAGRAWP